MNRERLQIPVFSFTTCCRSGGHKGLTSADVIRILQKNGFTLDHSSGSHRIFYNPISKKRVIVPFHKKDLPKGTLLAILKQAGISREEI